MVGGTRIELVVIGLLAAPIANILDRKSIEDPINDTGQNFDAVQQAINEFYFQNNRYPCPADPTLTSIDANYGYERCDGTDWARNDDGILEGNVPFSTLKISPDKAMDGWSRMQTYAVSMSQSDINTPPAYGNPPNTDSTIFTTQGLLVSHELKDDYTHPITNENVCPTAGIPGITTADLNVTITPGGHFALISHGENGMGAYTSNNSQIEACATGVDVGALAESQNCNGSQIFLLETCQTNITQNVNRYDDYVRFSANLPTRIWETPNIISDNTVTNISLVGIGVSDPQFGLEVAGNVKAEGNEGVNPDQKGNALSDLLCTNDVDANNQPTTCFDTSLITGNHPDMNCGASSSDAANALTGIANSKKRCNLNYLSGNAISCPTGMYMKGIFANGNPDCAIPPS